MQLTTALALITGVTIAVVHALAMSLELYWRYGWLDIPMHGMGGVALVLFWATLVDIGALSQKTFTAHTIAVVTGVIVLLWEVFGVLLEGGFKENFFTDTAADIFCGGVGVVVGYYIVRALRSLDI